jgi:hypothetical protein
MKMFGLIFLLLCFGFQALAQESTTKISQSEARLPAQAAPASSSTAFTPSEDVPFGYADFTWAPASYAPLETPLATKYFVPEIRLDSTYHYSFNNPIDNTISGSSEVFRANEFQITQIGVGGDFNYQNVGFRLMTQFGMYSTTTPRNDASPARGQWNLADAYRYISEAYASYHLDVDKGINIQTGIFMSYIGLWSYYNFDNWTYQPSYVSSNTPWFFNGMRVQYFPSNKLKIEPWLVNGWQSYGEFNKAPGVGLQILWKPDPKMVVLGNQYYGTDTLGTPDRRRIHTDDSIMYKYFQRDGSKKISQAAASFTFDAGCENGGGVACNNQYFLGFMAYNRLWFDHNLFGLTFGGGAIVNPGRYLVLMPPINGATAASGASNLTNNSQQLYNYFTENPGDPFNAWDIQLTGDYMPTRNVTFRLEYTYRTSSVPYFAGPGGMTPAGGNQGSPGSYVSGFVPDLQEQEHRITAAMMVRL